MNEAFYVDSHTHLDLEDFDADRSAVVERAKQAGVCRMLIVAQADEGSGLDRGLRVAKELHMPVSGGLHPHEAKHWSLHLADRLRHLGEKREIRAVGEIGLDFHYDHSPRDKQQEVFREQIRIARSVRLPVIIHSRNADPETIAILREEKASDIGGVIHCFTGTQALADAALDLGFFVSFSGIACFPKAGDIRDVARKVPLDRVLVETDCPFLAPPPFRGQRNEPSRVAVITEVLARDRHVDVETLGRATVRNFDQLFGNTAQ